MVLDPCTRALPLCVIGSAGFGAIIHLPAQPGDTDSDDEEGDEEEADDERRRMMKEVCRQM